MSEETKLQPADYIAKIEAAQQRIEQLEREKIELEAKVERLKQAREGLEMGHYIDQSFIGRVCEILSEPPSTAHLNSLTPGSDER